MVDVVLVRRVPQPMVRVEEIQVMTQVMIHAPRGKLKGTACRWNERGFGFIKPADGGEDLFCHVSGIQDGNMLREGDEVEYETKFDDRKGKDHATNVTGGHTEERRSGGGGGGYDDRRGGGGGGGGRDRYDDRRDDRRGGGDRYDDRRGGGDRDRYDA